MSGTSDTRKNEPLLSADPIRQYVADRASIDTAVARVLSSGRYVLGPECEQFERAFAAYLSVAGCQGTASGTDALELALRALDIGEGDEVIVPAMTSSATATAVCRAGAHPVIADVDPVTMTLSASSLEEAIGPRTRCVLPVHLYGHPCDMHALTEVVGSAGLWWVEDCAQAHGATWNGQPVGSFADAAAFSFYPTKNLAALGDGGALVSRDVSVLDRAAVLRQYGWRDRQVSDEIGMNSRLDEIQAAVLTLRLEKLDTRNARRRQIAERYGDGLVDTGLQLPVESEHAVSVYHQYVIRLPDRDALRGFLSDQDISAGILYPEPLHRQGAFQACRRAPSLENSEKASAELLCLPVYPELMDEEVDRVIRVVRDFVRSGA